MAPWDSTKSTEDGDGTVDGDEQLTAGEWNQHVTDGHFPSDELNFGTDANGNPVVTDPTNNDQVVLRYNSSAGQWELVNVNLELNNNDINNAGLVQAESVTVGDWHHIDQFSSLSSALSLVSNGDVIILDDDSYSIDRIDKRVQLIGTLGSNFRGTALSDNGSGSVSLNDRIILKHITIGSDVDINAQQCGIINSGLSGTITVDANRFAGINIQSGGNEIVFNSGTSLGIVDASRDVTVTDNGSNTIGDIA
jgi:hypothetical protein